MRHLVLALLPVLAPTLGPTLALPLPAAADCASEIAALFHGGALDPFVRPNRREVTVSVAPDGTETLVSDVLWDGVTRAITCTETMCMMQVETEMWMKPAGTESWEASPSQLPDDPEAFARAIADDMAANLSETDCAVGDLDGRPVKAYRYRTKTDPNQFGSWWGGLYTAYVDAGSGRLVRLEETESVASWAENPDPAVKITNVTYDDSISIAAPGE